MIGSPASVLRLTALCALLAGCGAAAAPPPAAPGAEAPSAAADRPPERARLLPPPPAGVPDPPATCQVFAEPVAGQVCDEAQAFAELARALEAELPEARDAELAKLQTCKAFPAGLVRALRADLAPGACSDAVVEASPPLDPALLAPDIRDALIGLGLAARFTRLAGTPPRITPPIDKARFQTFLRDRLAPWMQVQAHAIHQTAIEGSKLKGYGKAVAAIESGLADMRFVEAVRDVPLPEELASDSELSETYFGTLDQVLEPRKARGRDAALVGLGLFATEGALANDRVDRARRLLSRLYAGSRVDALDALILSDLPAASEATLEERLAQKLPVFYSRYLLGDAPVGDAALLRALLARGVPPVLEAKLKGAELSPDARALYGRFSLEMGLTYWQKARFAEATRQLAAVASDKQRPGSALELALAKALENGPESAAALMLRGPMLAPSALDVSQLDQLVKARHPLAGAASFDAAYLLSIVPVENADAAHWRGIAARFLTASKLLQDPSKKNDALERAKAAEQTAEALDTPAPQPKR